MSALISSLLFSIILALLETFLFATQRASNHNSLLGVISLVPAYLIYTTPVMVIYGSLVSGLIDFVVRHKLNLLSKLYIFLLSFILHILFGLIFSWYGLFGSILFFMIDHFLENKRKPFTLKNIVITFSFIIVIMLLMIFALRFQ